jgi:hypothetical protein
MTAELWFAIFSLALGFIGACFSVLASIIAYFVKRGEDSQDKHIAILQTDVDSIKQTLASYETHIGAGDQRLSEIRGDISDHVMKEEQIFWKKVDSISEAHKIFAEAVLQRVASMEAKMPNGEIQDMIKSLARVEAQLTLAIASAKKAEDHIEAHNNESEDWKRRIVALESSRKQRVARAKK